MAPKLNDAFGGSCGTGFEFRDPNDGAFVVLLPNENPGFSLFSCGAGFEFNDPNDGVLVAPNENVDFSLFSCVKLGKFDPNIGAAGLVDSEDAPKVNELVGAIMADGTLGAFCSGVESNGFIPDILLDSDVVFGPKLNPIPLAVVTSGLLAITKLLAVVAAIDIGVIMGVAETAGELKSASGEIGLDVGVTIAVEIVNELVVDTEVAIGVESVLTAPN